MDITTQSGETISAQEVMLPRAAYWLRITEADKATSKAGNQMIKGTFEIVDHEGIVYKGEPLAINGVDFPFWQGQSDKSFGMFNHFLKCLGLPKCANIEDMKRFDEKQLIGLKICAVCASEAVEMKDEEGRAVINPYTGKPVVNYSKKAIQFLAPPEA